MKSFFLCCLFLLLPCSLFGEHLEKKEAPDINIFHMDYLFQPDNEAVNGNGQYDLHSYRMGFFPKFLINSNFAVGVGVEYSLFQLRFLEGKKTAYRNFHILKIPFDVALLGKNFFFYGSFTPGINSDFREVDQKAYRVTGGGLVGFKNSSTLTFGLGIFMLEDFGEPLVIPVGILNWKALPILKIEIQAPQNARISLKIAPKFSLFAYYGLEGGKIRITTRDSTLPRGKELTNLKLSYIRLSGGISYEMRKGVFFEVSGGASLRSITQFQPFSDFKSIVKSSNPTMFMMVAIRLDASFFQSILQKNNRKWYSIH